MRALMLPVAVLALIVACGADEPAGPSSSNPQINPDPAVLRQVYSGVVPDTSPRMVDIDLPAALGTLSDPPLMTCYFSDKPEGPYWVFGANVSSDHYCYIRENAGHLVLRLATSGRALHYRIVVMR